MDDGDVGEEVVVLRGRHGLLQRLAVLEVLHQDSQTVQVRVLRRDDLEDGLACGDKRKDTKTFRFIEMWPHLDLKSNQTPSMAEDQLSSFSENTVCYK